MKIKVNNKIQEIDENGLNISDILTKNKVEVPEMVSVQLNGKFIKRESFETTFVKENDEVDFLYFMGGGKLS